MVDGKEADIEEANLGFMAVRLEKGSHSVSLSYETPYLSIGGILSLVGIGACAALFLLRRRKHPVIKKRS